MDEASVEKASPAKVGGYARQVFCSEADVTSTQDIYDAALLFNAAMYNMQTREKEDIWSWKIGLPPGQYSVNTQFFCFGCTSLTFW